LYEPFTVRMNHMQRLVARFYRTESGNEPVWDWLERMDSRDRQTIGGDIATVEFGWHAGSTAYDPVGNGILVIRSSVDDGTVEARTYFAVEDETMLLLHGESGEEDELDVAVARLQDHRQRTISTAEDRKH
jgi:hypothetical protein